MLTTPEVRTTENFITIVMKRETCGPHKAQKDAPCWVIENSAGYHNIAICNKRALKAGFRAPINSKSLRINSHKR